MDPSGYFFAELFAAVTAIVEFFAANAGVIAATAAVVSGVTTFIGVTTGSQTAFQVAQISGFIAIGTGILMNYYKKLKTTNHHPMTNQEKEELKESIQARIKEIEASIESLETTSKPVEPDRAIGRITRMDAIQIQQMQETQLKVARANILTLNESLEKIEAGTFGQCRACKNLIGFERLKALPESTICVQCAEKYGR